VTDRFHPRHDSACHGDGTKSGEAYDGRLWCNMRDYGLKAAHGCSGRCWDQGLMKVKFSLTGP